LRISCRIGDTTYASFNGAKVEVVERRFLVALGNVCLERGQTLLERKIADRIVSRKGALGHEDLREDFAVVRFATVNQLKGGHDVRVGIVKAIACPDLINSGSPTACCYHKN
jgi:hypothetical protein